MSKLGTMTLTGASGNKYEFNVYPLGTEFNVIGAVYYVSKRTVKADGGGEHSKIYIGQTSDMSERFDNHHKADCFNRYGANCLSTHREDNEENRLSIESDLLEAYNPPCNG